jgi:hypothetical protein
MKLGTLVAAAGIALMNMNCAHEEEQTEVDERVEVKEQVHEQYAVEAELEGGCSGAMQLMCMTYCGGYCSNNGQSCVCPNGRPH